MLLATEHESGSTCSFCGKAARDVVGLLIGAKARICSECIGLCNDIIAEEIEREDAKSDPKGTASRELDAAASLLAALNQAEIKDEIRAGLESAMATIREHLTRAGPGGDSE